MEIQLTGSKNLYFGHPFSKETYTNSFVFKTPIDSWKCDKDTTFFYAKEKMVFKDAKHVDLFETDGQELRVVRGTKVMFIGDQSLVEQMHEDIGVYHDLCAKCFVKIANPEFIDFSAYTETILKDPLKPIEKVSSIGPDLAKKYMEYAVKYDADKKYSDRLITKPYCITLDNGMLILTDDFVDYDIDLTINLEAGVIGFNVVQAANSSHYTENYKEI